MIPLYVTKKKRERLKNNSLTIYAASLILSLCSSPVLAFNWSDLWSRPDQQGMHLLEINQPLSAAQQFQDPSWTGVAYYRAKAYPQALTAFSADHSAVGAYNRGNTLAQLGQFNAAIAAYDEALRLNPHFTDAGLNKALVTQLLQKQSSSDSASKPPSSPDSSDKSKASGTPGENKSPSEKTGSDPSSSRNNAATPPQSTAAKKSADDTETKPATEENKPQQHSDHSGTDFSSTAQEETQLRQQWLEMIPDDPGGLLRQQFMRDHMAYQEQAEKGESAW
jgi:Ca-activated chloride channel homolog